MADGTTPAGDEKTLVDANLPLLSSLLSDLDPLRRLYAHELAAAILKSDFLTQLVARERVAAIRDLADVAGEVLANGDIAEVAAPVPVETGRQGVVSARDALLEAPDEWVRAQAARLDAERAAGSHAGLGVRITSAQFNIARGAARAAGPRNLDTAVKAALGTLGIGVDHA